MTLQDISFVLSFVHFLNKSRVRVIFMAQTLAANMATLQATSARAPLTGATTRTIPGPERTTGAGKAAEDSADSDDFSDGVLAPPLDGTTPLFWKISYSLAILRRLSF
jgi:hypothetical protein